MTSSIFFMSLPRFYTPDSFKKFFCFLLDHCILIFVLAEDFFQDEKSDYGGNQRGSLGLRSFRQGLLYVFFNCLIFKATVIEEFRNRL
jgi:hypothetical protein